MKAAGALLMAGAALPLLSACAAAALPVLAASGVLGGRVIGRDAAEVSVEPTGEGAAPAAPASRSDGAMPAAGARADLTASVSPAPPPATAMPSGDGAYDAFHDFAAHEGTLPVAGSERLSALLRDPGALQPDTKECSVHPAAVLIDLDPAGGVLDPEAATHADRALAGALAALRAQEIAIGWISSNTADRAGAVRRALVASGLDPDGRDELALLRYPGERKQTRRVDFAGEFCVVAIAGDERGDFDELFGYLKDKSQAAPLDALIGKGWFLIPQPLS